MRGLWSQQASQLRLGKQLKAASRAHLAAGGSKRSFAAQQPRKATAPASGLRMRRCTRGRTSVFQRTLVLYFVLLAVACGEMVEQDASNASDDERFAQMMRDNASNDSETEAASTSAPLRDEEAEPAEQPKPEPAPKPDLAQDSRAWPTPGSDDGWQIGTAVAPGSSEDEADSPGPSLGPSLSPASSSQETSQATSPTLSRLASSSGAPAGADLDNWPSLDASPPTSRPASPFELAAALGRAGSLSPRRASSSSGSSPALSAGASFALVPVDSAAEAASRVVSDTADNLAASPLPNSDASVPALGSTGGLASWEPNWGDWLGGDDCSDELPAAAKAPSERRFRLGAAIRAAGAKARGCGAGLRKLCC